MSVMGLEIEQYQNKFEYIKGIKTMLADTFSRLVSINPAIHMDPG